ncbi:MAG: hypothetical protein CMQ11_09090 [Gammaproteobacteria bacterium]|nr:hypothetical protein [Gammaproteobacteria bacterium]
MFMPGCSLLARTGFITLFELARLFVLAVDSGRSPVVVVASARLDRNCLRFIIIGRVAVMYQSIGLKRPGVINCK